MFLQKSHWNSQIAEKQRKNRTMVGYLSKKKKKKKKKKKAENADVWWLQ